MKKYTLKEKLENINDKEKKLNQMIMNAQELKMNAHLMNLAATKYSSNYSSNI